MRTASLRIHEEHLFGMFKTLFGFYRHIYRLKLMTRGIFVTKFVTMSFFVLNCYICFNESSSLPFDLPALTIEEYIPLN